MFNKNFYPTPENIINKMGIFPEGLRVLEPSAGSGNIIDWLKNNHAKEVFSYEKNKDLAEIAKAKSSFLGYDFLESNSGELSFIDLIVMNPPFAKATEHLLHAWEVAREGAEIIAIYPTNSIDNECYNSRKRLNYIINEYSHQENIGNAFSTAERKTDVEVSIVKLYKPIVSSGFNFDGFIYEEQKEEQGYGIIKYNVVRDLVSKYIHTI